MECQVALVLVALCALLRGACTQSCEFDEHADKRFPPLLMPSARKVLEKSDPSSCRAACCGDADCDTAVLGLPADGPPQCFLFRCNGACTLQDDVSRQFNVFTRKNAEHARTPEQQAVPLMMDAGTRSKDNNKNSTSTERCLLQSEVGLCKAQLERWFFSAENQSCSLFIYGGCGGNRNNFQSQQECEDHCRGLTRSDKGERSQTKAVRRAPLQTELSEDDQEETEVQTKEMSKEDFAERCGSNPEVGPCRAAFSRWFFNSSSGHCHRFIYGGCKGNKNNYEKEEQCTSTCAGTEVLPSKKQSPEMSDKLKELCAVLPDPGPCRAAFPMFYFDPVSGSCRRFTYGGCKGNNNRYNNEENCTNTCVLQASSEPHGEERNHWTAAFFLFLTLAGVSFLVLTTLVVITLRRSRRLPQRSLSVRSDKVGLLPDSDQSSVDSLPLPESPTREV